MRIMCSLGGITLGLLGLAAVQAAAAQAPESVSRSGIAGAWALNREKSQIPEPGSTPVDQGGARDNGGRGRGGFGGPRGGDFGPPGGGGPSPEQMQATMNYVRRLMRPSERLVINGPKITRKYELAVESSELRVTTTMSAGIGGRDSSNTNRPLLFVYQRPA